jgi:uncharacterized repeat protein (TIGR02543 family)
VGTVTPDNTNNPYPAGATITLTAAPGSGWYFDHWFGDASGSINPLQVTMNSDLVITGFFLAYPTYSVALVTNGQGTIGLNPPGGSYFSNATITATATPAAGWVFTGWSGAMTSTSSPDSFAVDANVSLTGSFAQLPAFDVEPASVTNTVGSSVSFFAQAVGTAPLNYTWYFNGGTLTNATGTTLALTNATELQVGSYWAVATNNYGSATSYVATLTLTNAVGPTNVVTSPDEGSLLAAIARGGWVGISFNGTLTLTNTISITNNVVLDGSSVAATISGGNAVQLFYVTGDASLTISNLTLANGSTTNNPSDGGAIYNAGGSVLLVGCTLTNNSAQSSTPSGLARGGAIFNDSGIASLYQSVITGNSAVGGGGIAGPPPSGFGQGLGGAIYNTNGSVAIIGCQVNMNSASDVVVPTGNGGQAMGGAVFQSSGTMAISHSSFNLNQAVGANGNGMYMEDASSAYGGALAIAGGILSIDHGQFITNQAIGGFGTDAGGAPAIGGAVYGKANIAIAESAFDGNLANGGSGAGGGYATGGGIYNDSGGVVALNRCLFYSNVAAGGTGYELNPGPAGLGGGVFNKGQLAATNCTIAFNSAAGGQFVPSPGSGTSGAGLGGGLYNSSGAAFVGMNLTIATNMCSSLPCSGFPSIVSVSGLTAGAQTANTNGTFHLHNSILAYGGTNSNAYGPITDDGYNICSDGSANLDGGSSFNNTDPLLGPLGNYGGPTLCMALLANSPAIDDADPNDFPSTDQREYLRPFGAGPDIGAVEFGSTVSAVPYLYATPGGESVMLTFAAFPPNSYRLQCSSDLVHWTDLSTNGPIAISTNVCETISKQGPDCRFFRLRVQ